MSEVVAMEIRSYTELHVGQLLVLHDPYYPKRTVARVVQAPAENPRTGESLGQLKVRVEETGHVVEYARGIRMPRHWFPC